MTIQHHPTPEAAEAARVEKKAQIDAQRRQHQAGKEIIGKAREHIAEAERTLGKAVFHDMHGQKTATDEAAQHLRAALDVLGAHPGGEPGPGRSNRLAAH